MTDVEGVCFIEEGGGLVVDLATGLEEGEGVV